LVRLIAPAAFGAFGGLFAAVAARLRRHTREPAMPRMSDEWLRSFNHEDRDLDTRLETWRDRW
jgi:hypothetical protein